MSLSMLRLQVSRHLVLLGVNQHAVLSWASTPPASLATYHARQVTSRTYLIDKASSSFSVHSTDFDPSGEFSSRDQSRIFFYARSDEMNIFNKLQVNPDLDGKYFPSLRLPRKIDNTKIRVFAQLRVFPSCFNPVVLASYILRKLRDEETSIFKNVELLNRRASKMALVTMYHSRVASYLMLRGTTFLAKVFSAREASYNRGGNIVFKGRLEGDVYFTARLFKPLLHLSSSPIKVSYSVKSDETSNLGLLLGFSSPSHQAKSILVAPQETTPRLDHMFLKCLVASKQTVSEWTVHETSLAMDGYTLTEISAFCYRTENSTKTSEYVALLGQISIKEHAQLQQNLVSLTPASSWVIEAHSIELVPGDSGSRILKVKLEWRQTQLEDSGLPVYNVYAENVNSTDVLRSRKATDMYPNRPRTNSSMEIRPRTSQARSIRGDQASIRLARSLRSDRARAKLGRYVGTERPSRSVAM
ncbi:hypothetical protein IGI04_043071 [Brassica rapa subsp. trilocularis]|uniref:Uncharacterized protein n=1 Tax=Brassica rapa subsp. trilocularis TaxID=1813537 RepID=A0ABQ7KKC6_BRACM|nr:hypothetical protein IGI04_043071 [Brassica rapa subsp. trilocularis]